MKSERRVLSISAVPTKDKPVLFAFCDDGTVWKTENPTAAECKWEPINTSDLRTAKYEERTGKKL